jgi:purine-binding chemotaxis protein CheW
MKNGSLENWKSAIANWKLAMGGVPNLQLVVFALEDQRYALHLSAVERIVRAVEMTPLPKAPEIVIGVINVQGRIIPVFNIRRRFHLPEREIELSDQLIIANTARRTVALVVDTVDGVIERLSEEVTPADQVLPRIEYVEGIVKLENGLVLIHDLDKFLSIDEGTKLDEALNDRSPNLEP